MKIMFLKGRNELKRWIGPTPMKERRFWGFSHHFPSCVQGLQKQQRLFCFFFFFGLGVFYVNWMSHLLSIFYHRVLSCHKLTSTASLYGTKDYHSRSRKASHSYNMGRGAQHPNSTLKGKCMTAHLLRAGIGKGKRQESRKWEYL